MNPDIDIYGVYIPSLIGLGLLALFLMNMLKRLLTRFGLYRFVWHPPLFNTALYFIILSVCVMIMHRTLS